MFVTISKEQFESNFSEFEIIETNAREYVYNFPTTRDDISVRVFSSISKETGFTREKGQDAIRIVHWDCINDRPIGRGKKILRTEGKTSVFDRINQRIDDFVSQSKDLLINDFRVYVPAILAKFTKNSFAKSLLEQCLKRKSLSEKQLAYVIGSSHPKGYKTFEQQVKEIYPNFIEEYLENGIEDMEEKPCPVSYELIGMILHGNQEYELKFSDGHTENGWCCAFDRNEAIRKMDELVNKNTSSQQEEKPEYPVNKIDENIELISTKGYSYPFEYFNPIQSAIHPLRHTDCNIILSCATASGKTVAAEIIMNEFLKE